MDTDRPVYRLELEALPGEVPAHVRLRRLLKFALRGCALRCRRAEEVEAQSTRTEEATRAHREE
jgi:hypothetical protein